MGELSMEIAEGLAPLQCTPRAERFLAYWARYLADKIGEIARRARECAQGDGREVVCLNDVQAGFTQVEGRLWVFGDEEGAGNVE